MSDPERGKRIRELGDVAREMEKLKAQPAWETLRGEFEKRKTAYLARLTRQLTAGGIDADPLDQRQLDYVRGFIRGAQAVLDTPDNALAALESALRKEGERSDG